MQARELVVVMAALIAARLALQGVELGERALEVLAVVVTAAAALSFSRGDPPRLPWLLRAGGIGLVLVAHLVDPLQPTSGDGPRLAHLVIIAANVLGAAAMIRFYRVIRASELVARPGRRGRLFLAALALVAAAVVALCVAGLDPGSWPESPPRALGRALALLVSALADALVFVISARLVLSLLPMRDGVAVRPYLLLALDGLFFLAIDLAHAGRSGALGPLSPPAALVPTLAAIGGAAGISAALAQLRILRPRPPLG
ncbi:MAG: hypothetical protein H6711_22805 [Myxococcales bacterium]|nr:hypothetical protein [Myxococcales bacterium]